MKKLILTGLSLMFAVTLTFAQQGTPEEKAQATIVKLTEKLSLTEEQKTAVYPIVLEGKTAMQALEENKELTPEQRQAELAKVAAATDAKIAEQLTEEQKAAFTKHLEEQGEEK